MCEGAIAVDAKARIVWISDKYVATLGLASAEDALGKEVEEVIPNSLMREVVRTGQPLLLDIMAVRRAVLGRHPHADHGRRRQGHRRDRLRAVRPRALPEAAGREVRATADGTRRRAEQARTESARAVHACRASSAAVRVPRGQAPGAPRRAGRCHGAAARRDRHRQGNARARDPRGVEPRARPVHRPQRRCDTGQAARGGILRRGARAPTPAPTARDATASSSSPTAARCSSTRSATCRCRVQAKLLRVLQEQEVERLGSNTVFKVDVRDHRGDQHRSQAARRDGRFRSDLYYRLNVLPIVVPPLRERVADIEVLCDCIPRADRGADRDAASRDRPGCDRGAVGLRLAGQCARTAECARTRDDADRQRAADRRRLRVDPACDIDSRRRAVQARATLRGFAR